MPKQYILVIIVALVALGGYLLVSRSSSDDTTRDTQEVVASFYPLAFFAERVTEGTDITVTNLAGARDPHDYEPSRADIENMLSSQLVIAQGAGLEAWLEDIKHDLEESETPLLVVAEHLTLYELEEGMHDNGHQDEAHDDEHEAEAYNDKHTEEQEDEQETRHENGHEADEHKDDHYTDEHGHDHDHGSHDPHTWLDPVLAADTVEEIASALSAEFPEHRAAFEENAARLTTELTELDAVYAARLASCTIDEALISHDAAGYIARRYDLDLHAIAGLSTEDEPSAKLLSELAADATDKRAILAEQGTVTAYADTLARETGLELKPFNPLGRGPLADDKDYFDVMYENLDSFAYAFACDTTQ